MYFRRVIIKNMLCIRYKDLKLTRGLIGVFGKNGRGKSTLLNLMYALLTNDFSRFPGTRAQCINNVSEKKEEAYVYGEVVVDEHVLKIRRGLRQPAKSELVVDEEPAITDANKIKERIEEIIQMNSTLLDLFVFKQQDKIYDVFVATEATRKEAFQALNRTEKCELIHDKLGKALEVDQRAMDGFVDNSDEILQTQSAVRDSIEALEAEITEKSELLLNDVSLESANRIVTDWKLKRDLSVDLDDAREILPELKTKRDNRDAKVQEKKSDIADAVARLEKLKPQATSAAAALQAVEAYEAQRKRKRALTTEAQELARQYTERKSPTPVKTPKGFELKQAQETLTTLRSELKKARELLTGFDATGAHKCSECGTVLDRLSEAVLTKNRKILETHPQEIQELSDLIEDVENYNSTSEAYARWFAGHSAKVKANEAAQAAIGDSKIPDGNKEELQKTIDDCDALESRLETDRSALSELQEAAAKAQASVEAQQQKIRDIRERLEKLTVTEEKYERARTRLREHTEAREAIAEVRGELRTKQARLTELDEELETVENKAKRFQKTRQLLKIYQRAREVTHRDGLPTRVSQTNLAKLEGYVNDELSNFGDPFWVETGEDLQFIVHKPGEPPQTAPWLSTGWKCILAASFWMTIVTTWGCGMLCLDEPTANLDEDNRAFLAEALSRLTGRIRGNRQVIMVSHAEELRSSFDQVIDFTPEDENVQDG